MPTGNQLHNSEQQNTNNPARGRRTVNPGPWYRSFLSEGQTAVRHPEIQKIVPGTRGECCWAAQDGFNMFSRVIQLRGLLLSRLRGCWCCSSSQLCCCWWHWANTMHWKKCHLRFVHFIRILKIFLVSEMVVKCVGCKQTYSNIYCF